MCENYFCIYIYASDCSNFTYELVCLVKCFQTETSVGMLNNIADQNHFACHSPLTRGQTRQGHRDRGRDLPGSKRLSNSTQSATGQQRRKMCSQTGNTTFSRAAENEIKIKSHVYLAQHEIICQNAIQRHQE